MRYEGNIFRPPSEAFSLIVQVTIGCSYNRCSFCSLYKDKTFRIREQNEIIEDLEYARRHYSRIEKIFLCDGDALCMPMELLTDILDRCTSLFPECRSVSVYGNARDVLNKGAENLRILASKGLKIIYIGAESGSDAVLRLMNKGVSAEQTAGAIRLIESSGIKASVTFISGLGGKTLWREHAIESGRMVSKTAPSYFSFLTLVIAPGMPVLDMINNGGFMLLTTAEVLEETQLFFENINLPEESECVFRSNHVSNRFPLRGTFPKDRDLLINELRTIKHK